MRMEPARTFGLMSCITNTITKPPLDAPSQQPSQSHFHLITTSPQSQLLHSFLHRFISSDLLSAGGAHRSSLEVSACSRGRLQAPVQALV